MSYNSYEEGREKQILSCFDNCLGCHKEDWLVEGKCKACFNKEKNNLVGKRKMKEIISTDIFLRPQDVNTVKRQMLTLRSNLDGIKPLFDYLEYMEEKVLDLEKKINTLHSQA